MYKLPLIKTTPLYKTLCHKSLDMSQESARFGTVMVAG